MEEGESVSLLLEDGGILSSKRAGRVVLYNRQRGVPGEPTGTCRCRNLSLPTITTKAGSSAAGKAVYQSLASFFSCRG